MVVEGKRSRLWTFQKEFFEIDIVRLAAPKDINFRGNMWHKRYENSENYIIFNILLYIFSLI